MSISTPFSSITVSALCAYGGLRRVVELDVRELRAADDQLLLLGLDGVPLRQVVDVLLDEDVAAARRVGILVADDRRLDRLLADRILGAVDEAGEVAVVEVAEAVSLVDRSDGAARRLTISVASSKQRSIRSALMWKKTSPGVETACRAPATTSRNGCRSSGRGGPNRRSHASDAEARRRSVRCPSKSRCADGADEAGEVAAERLHLVLATRVDGER